MHFITTGRIMLGALVVLSAAVAHGEVAPADVGQGTGSTATEGQPECRNVGVTVAFKKGSHELDTNAKGALDGVASWLNHKEGRTLKLVGHTDTSGNPDANVALSESRAEAVKQYLLEHGIDTSRIQAAGNGETTSDALPASGRAVTFLGCEPAVAMAAPSPPAQEPAPAPPPPEPVAVAPEPVEPPPPPPPVAMLPPPSAADVPPPKHGYGSSVGLAFVVGGGYEDFTHDTVRTETHGGGAWNARLIIGTHSVIGLEAAYVGSSRQIQPLGVTTSTYLISNGAEGALRINIPIMTGINLIEPFGFAGIGWARYDIHNTQGITADLATADDVMTVPVGGGFAFAHGPLMLDVRGSWTATYYNNLVQGNGALNKWGVGGNVGFAF